MMASIVFNAGASVAAILVAITATPNCTGVALVVVAVFFSVIFLAAGYIEGATWRAPTRIVLEGFLSQI
jgi:hypothetical protein